MEARQYTDDERAMARVLGINVQTYHVSRDALALARAFQRHFISADVSVGKIYSGPNSEPKVEISISAEVALHLASLLDGKEVQDER